MSSEERDPLENPVVESDAVGKTDLLVVKSDAVGPQECLGLQPHRFHEQKNVEEGFIWAASEVVLQSTQAGLGAESSSFQVVGVAVQPTQAGLGFESHSFLEQPNVEEGTSQANIGVAVQPSQHAGLGLEPHSFQEQPNVEEGAIQANIGVSGQSIYEGLGLECYSFQEQPNVEKRNIQVAVHPSQAGLGFESNSFLQQPNGEGRSFLSNGVVFQPTQATLSNLSAEELVLYEELFQILKLSTRQVEASYQEEETGIKDRNVLQALPSDQNYLRNVLPELLDFTEGEKDNGIQTLIDMQKMQNHEEDNGIDVRSVLEAVLFDLREIWPELVDLELREFWTDLADLKLRDFWPELADFELGDLRPEPVDYKEVSGILAQIGSPQEHNREGDNGMHDRNVLQDLCPDQRNIGWIKMAALEDPIDGEVDTGIQAQTNSQQMQNGEENNDIYDMNELQVLPSNMKNVGRIELADLEEPLNGEEDNDLQAQTAGQQMQTGVEDNGIQVGLVANKCKTSLPSRAQQGVECDYRYQWAVQKG